MIFKIKNKKYPDKAFFKSNDNDGLHLCTESTWQFTDCLIDMSEYEQDEYDEACGITWGASATFTRCVFRNAGKLVLIGSGDANKRYVEEGKTVRFTDCFFDSFCRRGPEIQSGMRVYMDNCVIMDWGTSPYWDTRTFAIRVHDGGYLNIRNSVFMQNVRPHLNLYLKDKVNHICQACKDFGLSALFSSRTYVSGWRRACTVEGNGALLAENCFAFPDDLIIDNLISKMTESVAKDKYNDALCMMNKVVSEAK